jgi:hypothetical protein
VKGELVFSWFGSQRSTTVLVWLAGAVSLLAVVVSIVGACGGGHSPAYPLSAPQVPYEDGGKSTSPTGAAPIATGSPTDAAPIVTVSPTDAAPIVTVSPRAEPNPELTGRVAALPTDPQTFPAHISGYSYYGNFPPNSATIASPVIHQQAGGTGTYDDPITVAVAPGQYAKGTRFYIPNLRRYVIVEDECGSCRGAWLEVWIDGRAGRETSADSCINAITGTFTVVGNPVRDYPVDPGSIYSSRGCTQQYGNALSAGAA